MKVKWKQNKVGDRHIIQVAVVSNLSKRQILGYPTHSITKTILEGVLIPNVDRITAYIYNHQLDYVHFLKTATDEYIRNIADGIKNK
jgi:hypothetical protein